MFFSTILLDQMKKFFKSFYHKFKDTFVVVENVSVLKKEIVKFHVFTKFCYVSIVH